MADESLKEFVLDQLGRLSGLRAKRMFGGHGLYHQDHFFGILIKGRLYFLTDAESKADYTRRGMDPFTYEKGRRIVSMNYFEVPSDILEDRDRLTTWANRAIRAAAKRSKKSPKG